MHYSQLILKNPFLKLRKIKQQLEKGHKPVSDCRDSNVDPSLNPMCVAMNIEMKSSVLQVSNWEDEPNRLLD